MVSKNKKRVKKRKSEELAEITHVPLQKRKYDENEGLTIGDDDMKENRMDLAQGPSILPTRESLAHQLMVALRGRHFTIIEGPMGSGKTFIASYASRQLSLPLKTMQMGDQVDSKNLFGCYHCTEVAGQFLWKPSSFCQWLQEPGLILLEDIDLSNADVTSTVVELISRRSASLPCGDVVSLHQDVCLVATVSGKGKRCSVLDGVPVRIKLEQLTDEELKRLVTKESPRIAHLAKTLISIFRSVEAVPPTSNSRQLTSADLLRGCARVNKLSDLSSNISIFTELLDSWCLAESPDRATVLCKKVAAALSITEDQMSFHLSLRQPSFTHDDSSCVVGRCRLPCSPSLNSTQKHRLGHTRDVLQLMERLAVCVQHREPVLLVGETGVGKTSIVQSLASALNVTLKVVNLSPSSDTDELISGYKPASISHVLQPFTHFYHDVFADNFDVKRNQKFLSHLEVCLSSGRYHDYLSVVIATAEKALTRKSTKDPRWASVIVRGKRIQENLKNGAAFLFAVSRGAVLEAAQEGYWLLIDEINLAPPESLDAIVHAISEHVHPNFRLFACMNPATDAGKRRLPPSIRTRFTEFYVPEMSDPHQIALVVSAYLPSMKAAPVSNLVNFYRDAKHLHPSSYSLRTLCRALMFASENMFGNEDRSLHEAICMAFLTNLDSESKEKMRTKIARTFPVAINVPVPPPGKPDCYVSVEGYWIERGTELPREDSSYVVTKTVKRNLAEIARITSSGRFPILLEGETSAGKTSIIYHLARLTGNAVVRINNHEHTDVQEYMGSYVGDSNGRLVFREGSLVQAVRSGSWVILDELNLAPTDIIEALNRLLDDNRELYVPELNTVIRAHPRFRLFATQNPAGSYGGRKRLSRALLSRFVLLRFNHIPLDELSSMVCVRCGVHPSAASKMISVLSKLRVKRSVSGVFSAKDGLMTLRDVFRWAKRLATDSTCDDWLQVLANHGYFLLAGRCRNQKDVASVIETLESELKRKIEPAKLFALNSPYMPKGVNVKDIVMTFGMRKMLVMTEQAWIRNEAVLMVGETGGGKTSLAQVVGRGKLITINCHERTETADLLGRLRPRENGGFCWADGVVISAMKEGAPLLVDEISLAEDSVLERLNPLFEEDRTLLLSDAGVEAHRVSASDGFQMIATMNPGGDYGKKELSKALRNRFTEIWSSCDFEGSELLAIFDSRLKDSAPNSVSSGDYSSPAKVVIKWIAEFFKKYLHLFRQCPSVRDVVACADIYAACVKSGLPECIAIHEAVSAVFLDALNNQHLRIAIDVNDVREDAKDMLRRLSSAEPLLISAQTEVRINNECITIGALSVPYGSLPPTVPKGFSLSAPTCFSNFYRIARGLLINKPILLEGAPGCGKSSTVMALAMLTGHPITRLNLSDQTDLSDLFGSDVPIVTEDGSVSFRWEDGPVLQAIKRGEWVLLDEMNLASQAVLEGLNACFDHRRLLYIAELNRSFEIPPESNCRFFGCQNPRAQGGNRRALPKSFVNRFTNIYVEDLKEEDILLILRELPAAAQIGEERLKGMVSITSLLASEHHLTGGPFSFNLRDLLRWVQLFEKNNDMRTCFQTLFLNRMRSEDDRQKLRVLYEELFAEPCVPRPITLTIDEREIRIGLVSIPRFETTTELASSTHRLLASQATLMHQLATCIDMKWVSLIIGPRNCGKRSTLENFAALCGVRLHTIVLNAETDAQELIGSYEQVVDDSALNNGKATLGDLLRPYIDDATLKQLRNADDVTELETVAEMVLVDLKERQASVVEECREALAHASRSAMRFEWIDSAFVKAYLNGHWLLIEDVNLCSAAVLDRLNSCLESDGRLVISERQSSFEPLEPHPNFRVFLSMDARNGEISRAMRNRSVEMFVGSEQQWNTNPPDVIAVTSTQERIVSVKLSEMLSTLPIAKQLHFSALLSEMTTEEACRAVGLPYSEGVDDASQYICIAPLIKELHNERYDSWILEVWKNSCDRDFSPSLFLALLSTSTNVLRGSLIAEVFGECASPSLSRLRNIVQGMEGSHQPIDPRFDHVISGGENQHTIERFVIATVCDWFSSLIKASSIAAHSAEHYSRSLSKFEMTKIDIGFKNLQLIARVVDAIKDALNSDFKICDEHEVFSCCLRLALFVIASRRPLDSRAGCASLYLAWNELRSILQKSFEFAKDDQNSSCSSLLKLIQLMSEGWPVEAHEHFINYYLPLYEEHRLAEPFGSDEETERLSSCLFNSNPKRLNETQPSDSMEDDDVDVRKSKSPVRKTLDLISMMRELHRFFNTGTAGQIDQILADQLPFEAIRWRNEGCRRFAAGIALLNSEYLKGKKISSLRHTDAFSTTFLSFWEEVDFDLSLSSLSVQHLMQCELKAFASQLWRLAPNSSMLSQCIKDELKCAGRGLSGWADADGCSTSADGWKRRMEIALVIMENSLPPSGTLDPVIFGEERVAYQSSVFDAVNKPLTVLARWRQAVSRQPPNCDADSTHPVVAALWRIRVEMEEALRASRERPVVFRQKASQYSSMCGEMRAFFGVASTIVSVLRGLDADADALQTQFNSSQLSVAAAQLQSFAVSAIGFRKTVLSKFGSFVDVSSTFLLGLDIFLSALHEVCDLIEATERRRLLRVTTAFPMRIQMRASSEGLESTELFAWCCRDASPMPLRLKAAVVRRRISTGEDPMCNLEWMRHQWRKWYERNIAKAAEKDFVYRTKTEEEKDELDVQELFTEFVQEQEILPETELSTLVGIDECKTASGELVSSPYARDSNFAMALLWIRHVLSGLRHFDENMHSATIDGDLALLEEMASKVNNSGNGVIDVYRSASLAEFHRAAGLLEVLAKRTEVIKERWPEQVSLSLILEAISSFRNARLNTTHMKMSVLIENVIEQCEEWEKMADRANSLQHELAPLRELLVDWKKMEVRSWGELLNRVENDGRVRAQLVAFPLFDALFKAETPDAQNGLIAMATEWVTNASLLDYAARIRSVHCLAEWAKLLGHCSVSLHLHSIAAHYEQYLSVVEASLREAREPAEHALRDYVKIVKFNDLNLWNIKKSSQKAHTHLYKIVRKFRDAVGVPVSPYFDNLVEMDPPCAASPSAIPLVEGVVGHGMRARQLAETILAKAATVCDVSAAVALAEQTKSCDEAIRVQIDYQGEDEEKEKQQGYARNSRQRAVAMVIKESQSIGLNARKAMALNQEELTRSSLTEVKRCVAKEPFVRKCAGGRNACIRKAMSPNDQLGVATRKHLLGVVDYGMAWMLKCHRALADWEDSCRLLTGRARLLERMQSNVEAGWLISHERMASALDTVHAQATDMLRHTEAMQKRMTRAPDLDDSEQEINDWEHPLSRLHSESPETKSILRLVDEAHSLSKRMQLTTSQLVAESENEIFEKSFLSSSLEHLSTDGAELDIRLEELQKWFEFHCTSARSALRTMMPKLKVEFVASTAASVSLDPALLFVQNLYKALVENANTSEMRLMDRLDLALSAMQSSGVEKVVGSVSRVVSDCRIGVVPDCLDEMIALLRVVTQLFSSMNAHISAALSSFASLYYTLLSMSMYLFEKGYVNLIPKAEKQESGQGNADEAGEGGGMGEGEARSDAKDVTDEMEESGQIEGLQDDVCEPPTGDAGQNEKPIDMEEDFPEDIQDVDRNEAGDEENSGEDSEEEPEPEDQIGDVDDADDQQLDPKLWDEEEKDQSPQSMDDDTAAADNETNELAAKDDDPAPAGQKPEEDTAKGSTEEEADDVENADERDEDGEEELDAEKEDTSLQPEDGVDAKETEEEALHDGSDSTDEERENEFEEGAGDEENKEDNEEDDLEGENPAENPTNDEDMESRKDQVEVIEEGTGGEKTNDEKKDESGGGNEDEDKENEENQGRGQSKSDERGEAGKSAEKVKPEEKKSEKEQEDAEKEEVAARERELAKENSSVEDKDEGEGEQDETGCEMQNAPAAERQMVGAGSLEEAKLSKKDESAKKPIERKKPLAGTEESADGPMEVDDAASLEQQGAIHLAAEEMYSLAEELTKELTVTSVEEETTYDITERAGADGKSAEEAEKTWVAMCQTVAILAAELAENLRLILEPQRASKMQGDYRTGKRLNMRRLIPYIASDYRKDRIWMRRTKKAQRDYQVLIAVDDSASMNENGIHQVTCESVCIVEDALRRCDAGGVAVCSFGSDVKVINAFGDHMMPGPELLQKLSFNQSSTDLLLLLNRSRQMLRDVRTPTSEQLLIIISDGRGALAQGAEKVKAALAALQGVTVLFVILDSGPKSICELSVASFQGENVVLTPYLSSFPFPFYAIVKAVTQLPSTLAESIRQWFEMTVQTNSI